MKEIISIIEAMLEMGLIDRNRLTDVDYVAERVALYIKAKNLSHKSVTDFSLY